MKKYLTFLSILVVSSVLVMLTFMITSCSSDDEEQEVITFIRSFGGKLLDIGQCAIQTSDGGYLICGATSSYAKQYLYENTDFYLVKTDHKGRIVWFQTHNIGRWEYAESVIETNDGGYLLCGTSEIDDSTDGYHSDMMAIKTDREGHITWTSHFGGPGYDYGKQVLKTNDDGYIIGGYTVNYSSGKDFYLVKIDTNGQEVWSLVIDDSDRDDLVDMVHTRDGNILILGDTMENERPQMYVAKIDNNGHVIWSKTFGSHYVEYATSLHATLDGRFIILGRTNNTRNKRLRPYLIKINAEGEEVWSHIISEAQIPNDHHFYGRSIIENKQGNYVIVGSGYKVQNDNNRDVFLFNLDKQGNLMWLRIFNKDDYDKGNSVFQTRDGGYVIGGSFYAYGYEDMLLIKTDQQGNVKF